MDVVHSRANATMTATHRRRVLILSLNLVLGISGTSGYWRIPYPDEGGEQVGVFLFSVREALPLDQRITSL
jgi:hypothetical protein